MATAAPAPVLRIDWQSLAFRHWPLLVGAAAMLVPTLVSMARGPWSLESGVHGPIVVATGLWLVLRRAADMRAFMSPGNPTLTFVGLLLAIPAYVFGRAFDFISIEVTALLLSLLCVVHAYFGMKVVRMMWFPIFYIAFIIPVPGWILDTVTQPLKIFVSTVVTSGLSQVGYPIARIGVTLYVAGYQLLVECQIASKHDPLFASNNDPLGVQECRFRTGFGAVMGIGHLERLERREGEARPEFQPLQMQILLSADRRVNCGF